MELSQNKQNFLYYQIRNKILKHDSIFIAKIKKREFGAPMTY